MMTKTYFDPETGEELPRIADGSRPVPAASNMGQLLAMCEDGKFEQDLSRDMRKLVHALRAVAENNGGKSRGKVTVTLDIAVEGEMVMMIGDYAIKKPKVRRPRTLAFSTEDGRITPDRPGQSKFFGIRPVADAPRQFADVDVAATPAPLKDA